MKRQTTKKLKKGTSKTKTKTAHKTKAKVKIKAKAKIKQPEINAFEAESDVPEDKFDSKTFESAVDTSFFYTSDKFINSLDNNEIIKKIQTKYPNLSIKSTDSVIKKNILHFVEDEKFVESILDYYSLNIFELFKILYSKYSPIFKGMYLTKLRKILQNKKYADANRRTKY